MEYRKTWRFYPQKVWWAGWFQFLPSYSEVLLISDPRSGVGALVQETRTPGIVEGTLGGSGMARMIHIPKNSVLEEGQTVVTSGLGSVFPKGIPVGTLGKVRDEPTGLFQSAEVKPLQT